MNETDVLDRLEEHAREWHVSIERAFETENSRIAFGRRGNQPTVLKVLKQPGDEWGSGEILKAFDGEGVVRVYEYTEGAVLLERLWPGTPLVSLVVNDRDEEATEMLASIISRASASKPPSACPTVQAWAESFDRYSATGDNRIPRRAVEEGQRLYRELSASQGPPRLLHGDLHHYNVLLDSDRGWLAIDPKGVLGEIEYEIGAALRNPVERPDLFASPSIIDRRLEQFASRLNLNFERALAWTFAQAVLSAIWAFEDGFPVDATYPSLQLADAIRAMLGRRPDF